MSRPNAKKAIPSSDKQSVYTHPLVTAFRSLEIPFTSEPERPELIRGRIRAALEHDHDTSLERAEELAGKILKMCVAMGGSLTGEHGIGVEKNNYLPDMFSAAEIDCMKRLRAAFDPLGIANPGKMFPSAEAPALTQHGLHPLEKAGVISRE